MKTQQEHLNNLSEIRSIMERTSSFISLSGLTGIFAGMFAIIGAAVAFWYFGFSFQSSDFIDSLFLNDGTLSIPVFIFVVVNAFLVLSLALGFGVYFSVKKAKRKSIPIWDTSAKRMLLNLFIPLVVGGIFGLILLYHRQVLLIAPITLIFYGLALINASKYTLRDIRYLGISETILGLIAAFFIGYGLIFWTIGFGLLHILYGILMYYKYDR
jgi:hypothetical protein